MQSKADLGNVGDISLQKKGPAQWKVGVVGVEAAHDASMRVTFKCNALLDERHNDLRVAHDATAEEPATEWQQGFNKEHKRCYWWNGKDPSIWHEPPKWFRGIFVPSSVEGAPMKFIGGAGEPEFDSEEPAAAA